MADLQFDLFCNAIYTPPFGPLSLLSVSVPFTYSGLTADSTPAQVMVSTIVWEIASDGGVVASGVPLASEYTNVVLENGTGHAQTTLQIPTLAPNATAVVINCTIRTFINVVPGAVSPYIQPTYGVAIERPTSGNLGVTLPIQINNSAYSIPAPQASDITVDSSTNYPPEAQSSATNSNEAGSETSSSNKRDITISVPIKVTSPNPQPGSPPTYLGVLFNTKLYVVAN